MVLGCCDSMFCNTQFPLKADVYYSTSSQNSFGTVEKTWAFDQTIRVSLSMSTNYKDQQVQPDQFFWIQDLLNGFALVDPRIASDSTPYAMTDVLITNIRNDKGVVSYEETTGVRVGQPTLFELSGVLPHNGPFGEVDYYKIVIKRSDVQELAN